MANWKKVLVSGSSIEVANISASGDLIVKNIPTNNGSGVNTLVYDTTSGKIFYTGSYGGGGGGDSFFTEFATDNIRTENNVFITGAATLAAAPSAVSQTASQDNTNRYALLVSQSAYFYNHNVGYPSANAWGQNLQGSYFNNFNSNSDVSEVLRFIAGLLSSSAPDAAPNTFTLSNLTATNNNTTTLGRGNISTAGNVPDGNIPTGTTDLDVLYTIDRGFTALGEKLFENISSTIYVNPNFFIDYDSTRTGTSNVSSSVNANLFGLGRISAPGITIRFANTRSFDSDGTTFSAAGAVVSSSLHEFTNSTLNTTSQGITLATISTSNPAVIPAAYQDGFFTDIKPEPSLSSLFTSGGIYNIGARVSSSISSSGWYRFSTTASVYSGSQTSNPFAVVNPTATTIFFTPTASIFTTIRSELSTYATITYTGDLITSSSFTSRSLSGAPYLNAASWSYSTTASNAFRPLYTDIATFTFGNNGATNAVTDFAEDSVNGADIEFADLSVNNFTSATQNTTTGVITSAGVIFSASVDQNGSVPHRDSEIRFSKNISLTRGALGTKTNMTRLTSTCLDDELDISFSLYSIGNTGIDNIQVSGLKTFSHRPHIAGAFGQPVDSGSLALFLSADGSDPSTNNSTSVNEKFLGETYRRTIGASTNATDLETSFNSGSRLTTSSPYSCQVKPGFLVIPGTTYGYWYPSSYYSSTNYYWYLREVNFNAASSYGTLTITTTTALTLTALTDTSTANTLSIGILFRKGLNQFNGGSNTEITDLTKPGAATTNVTTGNSNPFSNTINIKGFSGTAHNSGTGVATITLVDAANQSVDATHQKVWLLVRMRGETTSNILQNITFAVS